jgi:hypothetical protein
LKRKRCAAGPDSGNGDSSFRECAERADPKNRRERHDDDAARVAESCRVAGADGGENIRERLPCQVADGREQTEREQGPCPVRDEHDVDQSRKGQSQNGTAALGEDGELD